MDNLHSPIPTKKIQPVVKKYMTKKPPGPHDFTDEFHQTLKKEIKQFYTNSSRKFKKILSVYLGLK